VAIQIYKGGQGQYVRIGTAAGAAVVILILAYYAQVVLDRHLPGSEAWPGRVYVQYGAAVGLGVGLALGVAWALNKPNFVDFLIATESEMKKVSWSNRAEVLGSTAVVIATVLALAAVIWVVDTLFIFVLTNGLKLW